MARKNRIVTDIEIVDIFSKGDVIGKKEGVAYLTRGAVPGDTVTLQLGRKKKGMKQGRVMEITTPSKLRIEPKCNHFDHCGGCNWQNLSYSDQLAFKEKRIHEQLRRLAGIQSFNAEPILGSVPIYYYRNKLEFTFINQRWLTPDEIEKAEEIEERRGLGFHVPGRFDWVLHIEQCHLQNDEHNQMRNFIYDTAKQLNIEFYDPKSKIGNLRNLVLRLNKAGEWMILLIVQHPNEDIDRLIEMYIDAFPDTHSFWLVHNAKPNDSYSDCPIELKHGNPYLIESFIRQDKNTKVHYQIGPKSFFQTNSIQAERLYDIVRRFADLSGHETLYDLYTGTGSIALFMADLAKKIIGIEYVPEAIEDAKENARINGIQHAAFFAGDMKDVLSKEFIESHGKPDVLITDPPRAGMHQDVVERILDAEPKRIVYVSCDPATQARDIKLLLAKYSLVKIAPVDMFPHTSHAENVALLEIN